MEKGVKKRKRKGSVGGRGRRPTQSARKRKAELRELIAMPGVNLGKLYAAVVQESRKLGDAAHTPIYPQTVALLDRVGAEVLAALHKEGNAAKTGAMLARTMRAVQASEETRVRRYVAESSLGAAAMQVEGVNKLLELRQELKREQRTGRTIDTMPEEQE